jgi:hypothetical protein
VDTSGLGVQMTDGGGPRPGAIVLCRESITVDQDLLVETRNGLRYTCLIDPPLHVGLSHLHGVRLTTLEYLVIELFFEQWTHQRLDAEDGYVGEPRGEFSIRRQRR